MAHRKFLSLLGMAQRAGKIAHGETAVLQQIRRKQVKLVILAADASAATQKKMQDKCNFYHLPLCIAFSRAELGKAIGRDERVILALTDDGFAQQLCKIYESLPEVDSIEPKATET